MVEMGQKIYTAIFKRIWRSSKEEFAKLYKSNGLFMQLDVPHVAGRRERTIKAARIKFLLSLTRT